jgi:hypothetical protein
MPNLSALSRGTQVLAAAGLLLLIVMFLPWQDFGEAVGGDIAESLGVDVDATWNAWHGFWGVLMGLMVIVLLAWVIAGIFEVKLPVEVPDGPVTVALGGLIFLFALIKNLADDYSTIWSYIGVLLAAAVAYGAWLRYQEAGGTIDALKAAIPRQTSSESSAGPAGTAPMQREPDVTPEPTAPQPPQTAEAAQPAEPAPPAQPEQPAPSSPPTTEPLTQTGPTPTGPPTPPREPSDETDAGEDRPPQPPPSSTGPS